MRLHIIIIFIFYFTFCLNCVHTCGIVTHNVISNMAISKANMSRYINIINNNIEYFQAGSMFPDWGFNCALNLINSTLNDIFRNASESTHWFNFMRYSVMYLNNVLNKSDDKSQQLMAFLFGITSHSVADILWHNLGIIGTTHQGFIQALANSDFNYNGRTYDSAVHALADSGGEFISAYFYDLSFIKQQLLVPYDDIIKIYNMMGINIDKFDLELCFFELEIEVDFITTIDPQIMYPIIASESPFLANEFNDWWIGGIESMAYWTQICMNSITNFIDSGDENIVCDLYRKSSFLIKSSLYNDTYYLNKMKYMEKFTNHYEKIMNTQHKKLQNKNNVQCKKTYIRSIMSFLKGSMFGYSLDVKNNSILIGAPFDNINRGAVVLITQNKNKIIRPSSSNVNQDSRFGTSVKFIDINQDGIDEIAIGEPYYNDGNRILAKGRLNIYNVFNNQTSNYIIMENVNNMWGISKFLAEGDCNNDGYPDLIVGVPYYDFDNTLNMGAIIVVFSSPTWKQNDYVICNDKTCNNSLVKLYSVGFNFWEQAGSHIEVMKYNNISYVLIGSPMYSITGKSGSIGKLSCWDLTKNQIIWTIYGVTNNSMFSSSFDYDDKLLFVGAPSDSAEFSLFKYQTGVVYVYKLYDLFNNITTKPYIIKGYESFGRFGHKVIIKNGILFITAPFTNNVMGTIYTYDLEHFNLMNCYMIEYTNEDNIINKLGLGYDMKVYDNKIYATTPYQNNYNGGLYIFEI